MDVKGHAGGALVCATGGTYVEESTGGLVQLGATELCALVDDHELGAATTGILITPWTALHSALTGCLIGAGRELRRPPRRHGPSCGSTTSSPLAVRSQASTSGAHPFLMSQRRPRSRSRPMHGMAYSSRASRRAPVR